MKATIPPPALHGPHLRTYEAIFRHPLAHNLAWKDVRSLLSQLGQASEEANGNLKVVRNGHTLVLKPARTKEVGDATEMMELRHFLERSGKTVLLASDTGKHSLVVIDHHQARIFRSETHGAIAQQILPHEPSDFFRHERNSKDFSRGQEKPDPSSFFGPVADALTSTDQILIFGNGKGTGSEMKQFILWLESHRPDILNRIIGSHVIDEHHLTDAQLLAKARQLRLDSQNASPVSTPAHA